jgi:thiol:disulfide interchange protein DsbC
VAVCRVFFINFQVNCVKTINIFVFGALTMLVAAVAVAGQAADETAIRKALGGLEPDSIQTTPVDGVYEVAIGPHVVYVSADGRYMFQGDLIDVAKRESLTEPRRRQMVTALLDKVSEDDMIIYEPAKTRHTITVFTDIDCGYCRKLHKEMQDYLDAGIRVRYMFFPRAGAGSVSWQKAEAVWCAKDRKTALTAAKNNKPIDMKTCTNPIAEHMKLVDQLGARGTPFIVLEDGSTQPGYLPAAQMSKLLDQLAAR